MRGWGERVDAWALGLMGTGLGLLCLALVLVPQRLAQRPASQGVLSVHMTADGQVRVWNQPMATGQLISLLARAASRGGPAPTLRLVPDPSVPWGAVQAQVARLGSTGLPLELQLP
jgi:hypothetical protein